MSKNNSERPPFDGVEVYIAVEGGCATVNYAKGGPVRVIIDDADKEADHDDEERGGPYEPEVEYFNVPASPVPGLLERLLRVIDEEIEQRQCGGNAEDWADLQALSDDGHAALRASPGKVHFGLFESGDRDDRRMTNVEVSHNEQMLDLEITAPTGQRAIVALEVHDGAVRALLYPCNDADGAPFDEPTFKPAALDQNVAVLLQMTGEG